MDAEAGRTIEEIQRRVERLREEGRQPWTLELGRVEYGHLQDYAAEGGAAAGGRGPFAEFLGMRVLLADAERLIRLAEG